MGTASVWTRALTQPLPLSALGFHRLSLPRSLDQKAQPTAADRARTQKQVALWPCSQTLCHVTFEQWEEQTESLPLASMSGDSNRLLSEYRARRRSRGNVRPTGISWPFPYVDPLLVRPNKRNPLAMARRRACRISSLRDRAKKPLGNTTWRGEVRN